MYCPYCKSEKLKVVDKRDNKDSNTTRRRRQCLTCNKRFTTYEKIEEITLKVQKRNGDIETFDRSKIKYGILRALKKRSIPTEKIEDIIDIVESEVMKCNGNTVRSIDIGNIVLREITRIDKLGAVLFASVYKEFTTLEQLQKELERYSDGSSTL